MFNHGERFKQKLKRQHYQNYTRLTACLAVISLILVVIWLYFAIVTEFSEQKTVYSFLVVLFSICFFLAIFTSGHFYFRLRDEEDQFKVYTTNLMNAMTQSVIMSSERIDLPPRAVRYGKSNSGYEAAPYDEIVLAKPSPSVQKIRVVDKRPQPVSQAKTNLQPSVPPQPLPRKKLEPYRPPLPQR